METTQQSRYALLSRVLGGACALWLVACAAAPTGQEDDREDSTRVAAQALGGSCKGYCGGQSRDGCYCDAACVKYGDCCSDKQQVCSASSCHVGPLGSTTYCSPSCPCKAGQGDCDTSADCKAGLKCSFDVGANYGFAANIDVCEPVTAIQCGNVFCSVGQICCNPTCGICGDPNAGCPDIACEF